jgi:microcystin-dependent protein
MEGTIAEIRMFAGNFAPRNWAYCNGQILPIAQNQALFSLLGTTYGGNGQTTFALPNMQSRVAVGTGNGPGLSIYQLGQQTGTETNTITAGNIPSHTHAIGGAAKMLTTTAAANANTPGGNYFANDGSPRYKASGGGGTMKPATVALALGPSGGTPVPNIMPYLGISYIICLFGIFPSRN